MNDPSTTIACLIAGFGAGYALGWANAIRTAVHAVNGATARPRGMTYAQKLEWHRRRRLIRDGEIFEEVESMTVKPEPRYLEWHEMSKQQQAKVRREFLKPIRSYR